MKISLVIFFLSLISANDSYAAVLFCSVNAQISIYQPNQCYKHFDESKCHDICLGSIAELNERCFRSFQVPCKLIDSIPSNQNRNLHIRDILSVDELRTQYYLLNQGLYNSIYNTYVTPTDFPLILSSASEEIIKSNIRISILQQVRDIAFPLKAASIFRRLSFGESIEDDVSNKFSKLKSSLFSSVVFHNFEQQTLIDEMDHIYENELSNWKILKRFDKHEVAISRLNLMQNKIKSLNSFLSKLSNTQKESIIEKLLISENELLFECEEILCLQTLQNSEEFYSWYDQRLYYVEFLINLAVKEANTLLHSLTPSPTDTSYTNPFNYLDTIYQTYGDYIQSNANDNLLKRFESAINISFLQEDLNGSLLYELLSADPVETTYGISFIEQQNRKKVTTCDVYEIIEKKNIEINDSILALLKEIKSILKIRTIENLDETEIQIKNLFNTIDSLNKNIIPQSTVDRFRDDRVKNFIWTTTLTNNTFDNDYQSAQLEYISALGMFWDVSMAYSVREILPYISKIDSDISSFLPFGEGELSSSGLFMISMELSPHLACASKDKEVKVVLRITRKDGTSYKRAFKANIY
jgi:hypothetical protein